MGKIILSFCFLALLGVSDVASALNVKLLAHNQRSGSGTRSTLVWKSGSGCTAPYQAPCLDPSPTSPNPFPPPALVPSWNFVNGVVGSNATWDWTPTPADPKNGVLTGTGFFWTTSFISSTPNGTPVISDKVTDLVIDTTNKTTDAARYDCIEGTFLGGVHASGCKNIDLGFNSTDESFAEWNVGGNPKCVTLEIFPDDFSLEDGDASNTGTPLPRGANKQTAGQAGPGCVATSGGFDLWTVVDQTPLNPTQLILSNGICLGTLAVEIACHGANWLTFAFTPDANDDGPINALQGDPLPINVLANDIYPTPTDAGTLIAFTDPVTVAITTPPVNGTAVVTVNGIDVGNSGSGPKANIRITYTAGAAATGTDSFVYKVTDGAPVVPPDSGPATDSATVAITILTGGANADSAQTHLNTAVNINVGANDSGFVDPVTIKIEALPDHGGNPPVPGAPGPAANATVNFTPAASPPYPPTYLEHFTYRITDANSLTATAVVTVTVNNAIPVAGGGFISNSTTLGDISTQGTAPLGQTGTFSAPGAGGNLGDPVSIVSIIQGMKGNAVVDPATNVMTYTVTDATFYQGQDDFTYTITDADGETATATVTAQIPNVVPVLPDTSIFTNQDATSTPVVLGIIPGNGTLAQHTVVVTRNGSRGDCALAGTSLTYTPDPGFAGADSCIVTVTDEQGNGQSDASTITVTVNAVGGGGGGGGGPQLPAGGSSALDLWSLSLLAGTSWLRRRWPLRGRSARANSNAYRG